MHSTFEKLTVTLNCHSRNLALNLKVCKLIVWRYKVINQPVTFDLIAEKYVRPITRWNQKNPKVGAKTQKLMLKALRSFFSPVRTVNPKAHAEVIRLSLSCVINKGRLSITLLFGFIGSRQIRSKKVIIMFHKLLSGHTLLSMFNWNISTSY